MIKFNLDIDPATLSTAQQMTVAFKIKRIIKNPRVVRSTKIVKNAMIIRARQCRRYLEDIWEVNPKAGVSLRVCYWFAFPQTGTKREKATWYEGMPVVSSKWGDLDNRQKGFQDALEDAGVFPNDCTISELLLRKRYTFKKPHIEIGIAGDGGSQPIFKPEKPMENRRRKK